MKTIVRYFPRSGLVMIRGLSVTTTFRVKSRANINIMLDWLGYCQVREWQPDGSALRAETRRANSAQEEAA